jgi:hypothetical protein
VRKAWMEDMGERSSEAEEVELEEQVDENEDHSSFSRSVDEEELLNDAEDPLQTTTLLTSHKELLSGNPHEHHPNPISN